jgi:hypothetical protein
VLAALAASWLFVGSALPALAHPVSDWELKNLPRFPSALADSLAAPGLPDSAGLVGPNRTGWRHVAYQRPALWALRLAAARGDEVLAERAWPAVAAAFARQTADGGFSAEPGLARADDLAGTSLWLGDLAQTLLVLQSGPLRGWFRARTDALRPQVLRSAGWLLQGSPELERRDARSASGLFAHSLAFTLTGELDHDEARLQAGRRFLERARKRSGHDGRFAEPHRTDPYAQGASLLRLQVLDIYYPSFENGLAIGRGAEWLLAHAAEPRPSERSRTDNPAATASPLDLVLALLYRGALADDPRAFAAADRAFRAIEPAPDTRKPSP